MSAPIRPPAQETIAVCPMCQSPATSVRTETAIAEQYADGGVGEPGDPRRLPLQPSRRMVPGKTRTLYVPCGHDHECDQEALVVIFDEGVPDHEVCPVCGKAWR